MYDEMIEDICDILDEMVEDCLELKDYCKDPDDFDDRYRDLLEETAQKIIKEVSNE